MDEFTIYFVWNIIISAIITAFTYGFGPVIAAIFWGKQSSKKKFKIFCIIYTIIVWFVWQMYKVSCGDNASIVPAVLWGYVFHSIASRIINKIWEKDGGMRSEQQNLQAEKPSEKDPEIQRWYTCPKCGQLVRDGEECDCEAVKLAMEEERKKKEEQRQQKRQALKKAFPLYAVCAILLVAVCVLGVYSYNLKIHLDDMTYWNNMISFRYEKQKDEIKELENRIKELESANKNAFWDVMGK